MLRENWIREGSFTDVQLVRGALTLAAKLRFCPASENDDVSMVWLPLPQDGRALGLWRLFRALRVTTPWPSWVSEPERFCPFLREHVLGKPCIVRRRTPPESTHPVDDFFPTSIFNESADPEVAATPAKPQCRTLDVRPGYVLHSPYPDETWRGLEKCSATRDGPLVFGAHEGAEEVLGTMEPEVAAFFRIVEVCIVTPAVRRPLDSSTYTRVLDVLDQGEKP